ncbi:efflux transporter outer membrane subunit [Pelagicoccus sp. SDUM812003]|uniref:efflux transporter outer membrane subunit n=1 Tax=Pelagicoccus sp. SDUM812003 TaxID=3041267 RepID=UPI00281113E7|nr:efflux transporter outer membrane subunit [Pelagicoccus sp. SDUM812003]
MKTINLTIVLAGLLGMAAPLGAFEVGPKYASPEVGLPECFDYHQQDPAVPTELTRYWWTLFQDQELDRLIELALSQNLDLQADLQRIAQARAAVGQARADLFPQLAVDGLGSRGQSLESKYREVDYGLLEGVLSYEVDLWGGVRKGTKAARYEASAQVFQHHALRLSIAGQVAKTWVLYRATLREEQIVSRTVDTRRDARDLIADRVSLGTEAEYDLARADTELATVEADLAEVRQRRKQLGNALALLLGKAAPGFASELAEVERLPAAPELPVAVPAEAVSARPDVAAAERQLAAAVERIGVARAAFYPSIRLSASGGWESGELDDLIDDDNRIWSFAPQVYLPVFQGGRNKSRLARAQARYAEQEAQFRQTVLTALSEVQTALDAVSLLGEREQATARAITAARKAASLSQVRYDEGFVSYLEVVDSERTALSVERSQVALQALKLIETISLIQSLGGGWELPTETE